MYRMRYSCEVKNGKIILTDNFDAPDGVYYLELKKASARSPKQNNYYWFIVELLGEELGYTNREMHDTLKEHFEIASTKNLGVAEFRDYIDEIIRWSAIELGIAIPDPQNPF